MCNTQKTAGVYANETHEAIVATLKTLQWFHAFLASDCKRARDPFSGWMGTEMTKAQAQAKLYWLINVAINRKAGVPDVQGRKQESDYQRGLCQDAQCANTPRLIVRRFSTPELNTRLKHRLFTEED